MSRRRFGRVRKLPSGRDQARYRGPDGIDRPAPRTFATRAEADRWLSLVEAEIVSGAWRDPDAARISVERYVAAWIRQRPGLAPRTVELYQALYRRHIGPVLGSRLLGDLTPAHVRAWYAGMVESGTGRTTAAKAYRLLRAVLTTAVDDELIKRNPCKIKGAGVERAPERPVATVAQVLELASVVPPRYRVLVLLAAFTSLRYGELAALRRRDIGPGAESVMVRHTLVERQSGRVEFGPPKSEAGRRTVTVPAAIRGDVLRHLADFVDEGPDALVFTGERGGVLRRSNFHAASGWSSAVAKIGLPGFHFHDLRHTGNFLASQSGASLADLMARMGHSSTRAARIYAHTTRQRDLVIADSLSVAIEAERDRARGGHGPES